MKKILPLLFKILDSSIGSKYSASLIREGTSEESAIAVIRIESPQVPVEITRNYVWEQLVESCRKVLADSGILIQFLQGQLEGC
jgi:hypothetical protein